MTAFLPRAGFVPPARGRFVAEDVVARLFQIDFPGGNDAIAGAEWWFQRRDESETIGYAASRAALLAATLNWRAGSSCLQVPLRQARLPLRVARAAAVLIAASFCQGRGQGLQ